jgi:CDP-4-dehydro-6-deoxyglucose reductase
MRQHTEFIREFTFSLLSPGEFKFRAGQFLMLQLPQTEGNKPLTRAYSLASSEQIHNSFRLMIKYIPTGVASEYFWHLKEGDQIQFTGPFGKLFFPTTPATKLFFLSTGSGIAPHLSYVESILSLYPLHQFHFLIGVRTQNDFFLQEELDNLRTHHQNFRYEFVLSRPDPSWNGRCGYLQHQLDSLDFMINESHFFICGYEHMARATKHILFDKGLPPDRISVEIY